MATSSEPVSKTATCPDCGWTGKLFAEVEYCPRCGQKLDVGSLRLIDIVGNLVGAVLSFELPMLRTARDLVRGPGPVAAAWIAGRRRTYVHPIQWIVVLGVIVALTYGPLLDLRLAWHDVTYKAGLAHYAPQYFAFWCIGVLLPIALVVRAFGKLLGIGRSWLHWYVLGLYAYGLAAALQLVINVVSLAVPSHTGLSVLSWVEALSPLFLLAWGAFGFVARPSRWRAVSAAFLGQLLPIVLLALLQGALVGR